MTDDTPIPIKAEEIKLTRYEDYAPDEWVATYFVNGSLERQRIVVRIASDKDES